MSVIDEIRAERQRQMDVEDFTLEHDHYLGHGQLSKRAACYALYPDIEMNWNAEFGYIPNLWDGDPLMWKPGTRRRDLIKAAALLVAEIEQIDLDSRGWDTD